DAVVMQLPQQDDGMATREVLIVSDVADIEEATLTGDLRGGTFLVLELATGMRADSEAPVRLFNLNGSVDRGAFARFGGGLLQGFPNGSCDSRANERVVSSGYVKLAPSRDPQRMIATLNLGWAAGETLKGRVAVRSIPWMAHVR